MKYKTTKKAIRETGAPVYKVGYCSLQHLLSRSDPFAYSAGVYGWSCDYYRANGIIISTGYNPIGTAVDHSTCAAFDKAAREIRGNTALTYDQQGEALARLLGEFCATIKSGKKVA